MTRYATLRWGKGRTHVYDWETARTLCGLDAPYWGDVDGETAYGTTRHLATTINCARCSFAATAEKLDHCEVPG